MAWRGWWCVEVAGAWFVFSWCVGACAGGGFEFSGGDGAWDAACGGGFVGVVGGRR